MLDIAPNRYSTWLRSHRRRYLFVRKAFTLARILARDRKLVSERHWSSTPRVVRREDEGCSRYGIMGRDAPSAYQLSTKYCHRGAWVLSGDNASLHQFENAVHRSAISHPRWIGPHEALSAAYLCRPSRNQQRHYSVS